MKDYTREMSTGSLRENLSTVFDAVKCNPALSIAVNRHNRVQAYVVSAERAKLTLDVDREQLKVIRDAINVFLKASKEDTADLLEVVRNHSPNTLNGAIGDFLDQASGNVSILK